MIYPQRNTHPPHRTQKPLGGKTLQVLKESSHVPATWIHLQEVHNQDKQIHGGGGKHGALGPRDVLFPDVSDAYVPLQTWITSDLGPALRVSSIKYF